MTKYLLAAEADKIQDLIFRSSRLREVVGGSQLLTRFCREVPPLLQSDGEIITSDGGGFRILFNNPEQANSFGEQLAEVYHRITGGTLSVARPVPVPEGGFAQAVWEAELALRRAKLDRAEWQEPEHMPYIALCASCGSGLAVIRWSGHKQEEARYLCKACWHKNQEHGDFQGKFLQKFYRAVVDEGSLNQTRWPGKIPRDGVIDPLDDVAELDARDYVAYLLADGNNMGRLFSSCCAPDQMKELSHGLSGVLLQALARPSSKLMSRLQEDAGEAARPFIPVLPLILGGDDLFALLPAPWALDFALCFAREYESRMVALLRKLALGEQVPPPTISVAVVIYKKKYPYTLAHQAGEKLLQEAKRAVKIVAREYKQWHSAINFTVLQGSSLPVDTRAGSWQATLRPYWVTEKETPGGLPLAALLQQRWQLRQLPGRRLARLQALYDVKTLAGAQENEKSKQRWVDQLQRLVERTKERNLQHGDLLQKALEQLGDAARQEEGFWRRMDYMEAQGHGLPDLLTVWDFAWLMDRPGRDYREE